MFFVNFKGFFVGVSDFCRDFFKYGVQYDNFFYVFGKFYGNG